MSRRPYRVRWWEPDTNAYGGASYSTRAKADFEAERRAEEGYIDVYTWEADDGGYMVPGSRWVCVSGAGLRMAAPDPISGNLLDEDPEDAESAIEANSRRLDAALANGEAHVHVYPRNPDGTDAPCTTCGQAMPEGRP